MVSLQEDGGRDWDIYFYMGALRAGFSLCSSSLLYASPRVGHATYLCHIATFHHLIYWVYTDPSPKY